MSHPTSKEELLARIESAYLAFDSTLSQISELQTTQPGVVEEWSVKDIVAHITFWQEFLFSQIRAVLQGQSVPKLTSESEAETSRINREAVLQSRSLSWSEVHSNFQHSVRAVLQTVEALSETDLFVPGRFQAVDSEALWRCIAGETYEHYQLHTQHVDSWLRKIGDLH
jgi:hypothetical protein